MARRKSSALTEGEFRIMNVLWSRERGTVGDVVDALDESPRPAYNTVLTMLRILERKGYVTHELSGRAHVYVPVVDRVAARQHAVSHLLSRFFDGSPELLVLNLLGRDAANEEDLRRVRDLIDNASPSREKSQR